MVRIVKRELIIVFPIGCCLLSSCVILKLELKILTPQSSVAYELLIERNLYVVRGLNILYFFLRFFF